MEKLPFEIIIKHIIKYLDFIDILNLSRININFRQIYNNDQIWKLKIIRERIIKKSYKPNYITWKELYKNIRSNFTPVKIFINRYLSNIIFKINTLSITDFIIKITSQTLYKHYILIFLDNYKIYNNLIIIDNGNINYIIESNIRNITDVYIITDQSQFFRFINFHNKLNLNKLSETYHIDIPLSNKRIISTKILKNRLCFCSLQEIRRLHNPKLISLPLF